MATSYKEMVSAARERVETIAPADAAAMDGAAILDVREPAELSKGRIDGDFIHIPRGLLEPKADAGTGMGDPALLAAREAGPVLVLCAVGGRAALAAATLADMGYDARIIEGGFAGWKAAGLPSTAD